MNPKNSKNSLLRFFIKTFFYCSLVIFSCLGIALATIGKTQYHLILVGISLLGLFAIGLVITFVVRPVFTHLQNFQQIESDYSHVNREILAIKETLDAGMAVSATDVHGKLFIANKIFCQLSGYKVQEIIGQAYNFTSLEFHSQEFFDNLWQTVFSGKIWRGEIQNRNKDGNIYWLDTIIKPIYNENQEIEQIFSIAIEITKRKKTEEKLILARKDAERANYSKSAFIANISHEIRTPLNAIIGFSDILKNSIEGEKERQHLSSVIKSSNILLTIIDDLIHFSRLEAGMVTNQAKYFSIQDLLSQVETKISSFSPPAHIEFRQEVSGSHFLQIYLDEDKLVQIIGHLLSNAFKFTSKGWIHLALDWQKGEETNLKTFKISVEDTGIGINKEDLQYIFDFFETGNYAKKYHYAGIGLGLPICRRLTKLMDGELSVFSEVDKGTKFELVFREIPFIEEEQPKKTIPTEISATSISRKIHLLLADDFEPNLVVLKYMIPAENFLVSEAIDGRDLLQQAQEKKPDIILSDLNMPGYSGLEVARSLKQQAETKNIPFILISSEPIQKKDLSAIDEILLRPLSEKQLLEMIYKFVQPVDYRVSEQLLASLLPLRDEWQVLTTNLHFSRILTFAEQIASIGQQHNHPELQEYARQLTQSAKKFDAFTLPDKIQQFAHFIDKS